MGFKALCKRTGAVIYKHRADLMFGVGLGCVTAGTILLIKDAEKISYAFDEHLYRAKAIEENDAAEAEEKGAGWRDEKERKQLVKEDFKLTVTDLAKTVGKDCAFIIGGEVLQGMAHVSLNKQLANATLLAANLSAAYANLKQRVVEDQGEEKLNEYLYGPQIKKVVVDENGNVTEVTEMIKDQNATVGLPPHCFFFDEGCSEKWNKGRGVNKETVEDLYFWLNQKLQVEGFLFENDIRREFGVNLVECGWTSGIFAKDKDGNVNTLSFGIDGTKSGADKRFLDGEEDSVLIRLNLEDDILSQLHLFKH